jgi:hypothetical protein
LHLIRHQMTLCAVSRASTVNAQVLAGERRPVRRGQLLGCPAGGVQLDDEGGELATHGVCDGSRPAGVVAAEGLFDQHSAPTSRRCR